MYRKNDSGWIKHGDFIFLDLIALEVSFFLAYVLMRYGIHRTVLDNRGNYYTIEALFIAFSDLAVVFFTNPYTGILRRGRLAEFNSVVRQIAFGYAINLILTYFLHIANFYSRLLMILSFVLSMILCFLVHLLRKRWIRKRADSAKPDKSMAVVTTSGLLQETLENITKNTFHSYRVPAVFLVDQVAPAEGSIKSESAGVKEIPVYGREQDLISFLVHRWCDEVYINTGDTFTLPQKTMDTLLTMGITVHDKLKVSSNEQIIEQIGRDTVVTTSLKMVTTRMVVEKRILDILGGVIGCIITGVLFLFLAPQIYKASPGPIFFAQTRIGRNGKKFRMYKFRSMYMDAEERKKEFLAQNKISDGMMFKLDDDPRIIGSEKKDKNGRPNGIGNKIRRTSLDEFPQFWNVLRGDMSLVGTRPPTVDEWQKYNAQQRLRMSIKPGITGLWQISGRSDILSFDEVVKLDTDYIRNMSIWYDLKILLKTVEVVLKHKGAE